MVYLDTVSGCIQLSSCKGMQRIDHFPPSQGCVQTFAAAPRWAVSSDARSWSSQQTDFGQGYQKCYLEGQQESHEIFINIYSWDIMIDHEMNDFSYVQVLPDPEAFRLWFVYRTGFPCVILTCLDLRPFDVGRCRVDIGLFRDVFRCWEINRVCSMDMIVDW